MKPTFNPQTHALRRVRIELWKPDTQQGPGGPLIATGWKVCRRRRKKTVKPAPHPEIPDLVESRVVPGLFFNFFQLSITYENRVETPPALVFRLLLFLESRAANGAQKSPFGASVFFEPWYIGPRRLDGPGEKFPKSRNRDL